MSESEFMAEIIKEAKRLALVVPLTPTVNAEPHHWAMKRKLRQRWAMEGYAAWLTAGRPAFKAVTIRPVFYVSRLRDEDNLCGQAYKGIIDGLKGHLVPDDSPEFMTQCAPEQVKVPRKEARLELRMEGICEVYPLW